MAQLSQELVDQICSYLSADDLASCYNVSTKFRAAAEDQGGQYREDIVRITSETKQSFIDRYSGFRLRYLTSVYFCTSFPEPEGKADLDCYESVEERHRKDQAFTAQVQDLFATLKQVEERAGERNRGKYQLTLFAPSQECSEEICLHRQYAYFRTHLLEPELLPSLQSVHSFQLQDDVENCKLDYRILVDLLTRFPNIKDYVWRTGKHEWTPNYNDEPASLSFWDYDGPRRDARHEMAKAITPDCLPTSLELVELDFIGDIEEPSHWKSMPDLVSPALKDPFSTSLRILSYPLTTLSIRVQADETLFWPEDGPDPAWPNLQCLCVMFHKVAPSGAWYFEGPRGEGRDVVGHAITTTSYPPCESDEEWESFFDIFWDGCKLAAHTRSFEGWGDFAFRIMPNESILLPFLTGFAKAAINMPKLREAFLWCPLLWSVDGDLQWDGHIFDYFDLPRGLYPSREDEKLAWGWAYFTPNLGRTFSGEEPGEKLCEARQMWWKVGKWRPNPELHSLFQKIGQQQHGDALKEYWKGNKYGEELIPRWYFDQWMLDEYRDDFF